MWKTVEGTKIEDVVQFVRDTMKSNDAEKHIHIGTDSQQAGSKTEFVTVVAVLSDRKGGRAVYRRVTESRIQSLRERLLREVWLSVEVALQLTEITGDTSSMTVHIDANPNTNFRSSSYVKELTAMVVSQGFEAVLKPEAWCASHCADHVVKVKVLGM